MFAGIITVANEDDKYVHIQVFNHRKYCDNFAKFVEDYRGVAEEITDEYIIIKVKLNDKWREECYNLSTCYKFDNESCIPYINTFVEFDPVENRDGFLYIKCKSCLSIHEEIDTAVDHVIMHPVRMELIFDETHDWKKIIWPEMTKITMYSDRTGNDDIRGGGCGNSFIKFNVKDFTWTAENSDGITLKEIAECIYRIKGSKYDYWYERFAGISLKKKEGKHWTYFADFDYGS